MVDNDSGAHYPHGISENKASNSKNGMQKRFPLVLAVLLHCKGYNLLLPGWDILPTERLPERNQKAQITLQTSVLFLTCFFKKSGGTRDTSDRHSSYDSLTFHMRKTTLLGPNNHIVRAE